MYRIIRMEDTIRIPPARMTQDFDDLVSELVQESFEGRLNTTHGIIVLTTEARAEGDGAIVHGSGEILQNVSFDALVFKPENQEILDGIVAEVVEFGAFIHIGPLDALVHSSQIMDDFMTADVRNERIVGKDSGRFLDVMDNVRCRVVSVKFNERNPRESKIGVTMRQPALGRFEWLDEDRRRNKAGAA